MEISSKSTSFFASHLLSHMKKLILYKLKLFGAIGALGMLLRRRGTMTALTA
jgi:hypothetical protein